MERTSSTPKCELASMAESLLNMPLPPGLEAAIDDSYDFEGNAKAPASPSTDAQTSNFMSASTSNVAGHSGASSDDIEFNEFSKFIESVGGFSKSTNCRDDGTDELQMLENNGTNPPPMSSPNRQRSLSSAEYSQFSAVRPPFDFRTQICEKPAHWEADREWCEPPSDWFLELESAYAKGTPGNSAGMFFERSGETHPSYVPDREWLDKVKFVAEGALALQVNTVVHARQEHERRTGKHWSTAAVWRRDAAWRQSNSHAPPGSSPSSSCVPGSSPVQKRSRSAGVSEAIWSRFNGNNSNVHCKIQKKNDAMPSPLPQEKELEVVYTDMMAKIAHAKSLEEGPEKIKILTDLQSMLPQFEDLKNRRKKGGSSSSSGRPEPY